MKKFISLLCLVLLVFSGYTQDTTIAFEKFGSIPVGWTVTPSGSWDLDYGLYQSDSSSICGYVPNLPGDSTVLMSPYYDFRNYSYVFLRFNQICKVVGTDICKIYIQENHTGARWREIPTSVYQGINPSAYQNARFSQMSYPNWIPNDSLAIPTNAWWRTELFDLTNEASYAQVRFKFVIKRGNGSATHFAYGWLIDDFELIASQYEIKPPLMEDLSTISDTVYQTGPFAVIVRISPQTIYSMVQPINLIVKYQHPNHPTVIDTIQMTMIDGDTIFAAMIPQKIAGTNITYYVYAHDTVGNNASLQYSFYILKTSGGGQTGNVIVGNGTSTESYIPFYRFYDYSWSRFLFLASELSINSGGGLIQHIAFNVSTAGATAPYQTCYFKAVSDNAISSNAYVDPVTDGASLVWSGTFNPVVGWNDFTLDNTFLLAPGKNLLVYWQNNADNYTTSTSFYSTSTLPVYMAAYKYQDGSFPTVAGTLYEYRPNTRFYIVGGSDDTNSVALYALDSPLDSVVAAPGHQVPIVITIKNKGYADLDSCQINWSLNGIPQQSYTWRGYMPWDFNASDTIGWYTPSVNKYDTLVVWTSLPNGQYDSTTYDDTITRYSFGVTGLNMAFVSYLIDTVYNTGPFDIQAVISSRTGVPVPTPVYLYVTSVYDTLTTYDTILMQYTLNDTFVGRIPQHLFGTDISYSVSVMDAVGNLVSIYDNFYVKRIAGGSSTGYVIVGTGTSTTYSSPMNLYYNYSWTRQLYLADELNPASMGGFITKLAWQYAYATPYTYTNQTCYFKAVNDINISSTAYIDPVIDGATEVWSGTINLALGWSEINLTTPFVLPPGKNLMIYWHHNHGTYPGSTYVFNYSTTTNYQAVYCQSDGSFPSGSTGTLTYNRPNARFYVIGNANDSNSVALHSIDYPIGSVLATPNGDSVGVIVTIKNKGLKNLTTCNISWTLNGIYKGTKQWTGNLTEDFNDTVTIGYYMPRACMTDDIMVWVSLPNGETDSTTYDDTLSTTIYGEAAVEVTLTGPVDTIYHTGPYQINALLISLTNQPVDTNVYLKVSYTYGGLTTYDTIRMTNSGNDTLWTTILPQQPYTTQVTYSISVTDSLGNVIVIDKWFYLKRPDASLSADSIIVGTVLTGGVFVVPFDCRYAASYSRVVYTGIELGVSATGAMISTISWKSYQNTGYTYSTTRTNQAVYMKVVDNSVTTITNGTYIDPITDGAVLVWSGSMNLSATPGEWHKVNLTNPFLLPANKNIIVYFVDQHGTGGGTFAWNYYTQTNASCFGYGTSLTNLTSQSTSDYKPWTCFGFSGGTSDSDGVATFRLLSPESVTTAGVPATVTAIIKNKGMRNLTSCKIDWTLNGVAQTQYNWTGNLYEDFTDTVVLGSYMPNPSNYDHIKVWVSLPNGAADTSNFDDTLSINVYGKAGLIAEYVAPLVKDTVFVTGPFQILAHIQSLTSVSVPTPTMYLTYIYNNVTTYDTVLMTTVHTDSLYKVNIPQLPFGTHVTYSITVTDSIGNVITITEWFYVKRVSGGANTGYVIVGTGTSTQYMLPMDMFYNYSWTRQLYLANELSPSSSGGLITKLAWQYAYGTPYTYSNQLCYMEAVDASVTSITSNAYVNPASVNASLVWSGTISLSQGWVEITLDQPFMLPPGKNLIVHWHHNNGSYAGSAYVFNYTATSNNTAVYCRSDGGFPSGNTGTLTTNRPNARFYIIGGGDDTNSVGLVNVISPADTIPAYKSTPIQVVIRNKGMANLTSCQVNWTINGIAQPTYNWTGNLMEDFTDTVILDYFTPIQDKDYEFTFRVSMPNNAYDSTTYDDTLSCDAYAAYHGYNLTMNMFIAPVSSPYEVCFAKQTEVKMRLKNTGKSAILLTNNPLTLHYTVTGPVSIQKTLVISQGVIPVGIKDFIVDTTLDITLPGIYHFEIISNIGLDTIYFDDTLRMDYNVKRILLPYDNDFSAPITDITFSSTTDSIRWSQNLTPAITPVYGSGTLHINSSLGEGTTAQAVLHAIDFQGCLSPSMEFWFAHDNNNPIDSDHVVVKISTNGGNTFTTKDLIYRYNPSFTTPGWQHYTIDLSDYVNDACVVIAFEANSAGGGDMWMDRLLITAEKDMEIALIIPQLDDLVACDLDQKELKVNITNQSVMAVDFDETLSLLTLEVTGAVTKTYVDTLSGILSGFATMDVVFDNQFDFTTAGSYDFVAYINNIDISTLNDTDRASINIQPDVSLISIDSVGDKVIGSSVYLTVQISNTGNLRVQEIPLHIQVDGINDVYETAYVDLAAGADTSYTLLTPYKVPVEPTYQLQLVAELSCDYIHSNDTLLMEGTVSDPTLTVASILRPSSTLCDKGLSVIYPQISINNSGNPETDVVVYFTADSAGQVFASFIDTIALVLNGVNTYNFAESYIVPNWKDVTTYHVMAYIYSPTYALEQDACLIFNDISIDEMDKNTLYLGQNIPNPAQKSTSIPVVIPDDGSLIFSIMSVSGQTLYMEKKEFTAGKHWIEIDINKLANGIYYYSIEYKGQRLVKKLTIQK